ncbi:MAG: ABC transporter, partial [Gammaproteobacteria bacterium]|nr:ABC transporter [Gammaproteobacteria bacterium]
RIFPFAEADNNGYGPDGFNRASELPLLEQWGMSFNNTLFVADDQYALTVGSSNQLTTRHLALLGIDQRGLSQSDVVSRDIDTVNLGFSGFIASKPDDNMSFHPLLQTSKSAASLTTTQILEIRSPEQLRSIYKPAGDELVIAARLAGYPESSFPKLNDTHIIRPEQPINAVVVADADILTDRYWVQRQEYLNQSVLTPFAGNADFLINILDNLSGSNDLIGVRGRASYSRPFTKVAKLRRAAEQEFQLKTQELEDELAETEQKLLELQISRDDFTNQALNSDQEVEIQRFTEERLRIRKELRLVQHNLDKGIRDLGTILKVINIGLMPILISILGILFAVRRRRSYS